MSQLKLSKWLKAIIIGAGSCGAIVYFFFLPFYGRDIVVAYPEFSYYYWPWQIFLWITAVPCYAALICSWIIADEIGRDNSFCSRNARLLKWISLLAAGDSAFFFLGIIIFAVLGMSHPGVVILSIFIVFVGIAVTVTFAALSHLVYKAARIREENEWTI